MVQISFLEGTALERFSQYFLNFLSWAILVNIFAQLHPSPPPPPSSLLKFWKKFSVDNNVSYLVQGTILHQSNEVL